MNFAEIDGNYINLERLNMVRREFNRHAVKKLHDESGEVHDVIKGKPYEIALDFGTGNIVRLTYKTSEDRDDNFERMKDILHVK